MDNNMDVGERSNKGAPAEEDSVEFWKKKYLALESIVISMKNSTPQNSQDSPIPANTNPFLPGSGNSLAIPTNSPAVDANNGSQGSINTAPTPQNPFLQQKLGSLNNLPAVGSNQNDFNSLSAVNVGDTPNYSVSSSLQAGYNGSSHAMNLSSGCGYGNQYEAYAGKKKPFQQQNFKNNLYRRSKGGKKHNTKAKRTATVAAILNKMIEEPDSVEYQRKSRYKKNNKQSNIRQNQGNNYCSCQSTHQNLSTLVVQGGTHHGQEEQNTLIIYEQPASSEVPSAPVNLKSAPQNYKETSL